MTLNFPGPYELRIFYDTTVGSVVIPHEQRLNVKCSSDPSPGALFNTITILNSISSSSDLETETLAWIDIMKDLFYNTTNFSYAELWKYTPGTFLSTFVSAYDITDTGDAGAATGAAVQSIFIFRTAEGGQMRVNLMEPARSQGNPILAAGLSPQEAALVTYIIDSAVGGYFLGRDTSYPFAFSRLLPGQNEKLARIRYNR
jgi:hypothetical protein